MNGIRRFNPTQLFNDGLLGQYSIGVFTGLIAAGTNGDIFQFRWVDALRIAAIRKVIVAATASTPFGATPATTPEFQMLKATTWTGQGTGGFGATNAQLSGNSRRSLMPASLVQDGDIRIATTTFLGAGTRTGGPLALAAVAGNAVAAVNSHVLPPTELWTMEPSALDYPLVLAQNEGFYISIAGNPGTGTMFVSVSVDWVETNAS